MTTQTVSGRTTRITGAIWPAAALLLLSACATPGGSTSGDAEPGYGGGIQTRSIGSAPQSREAQNDSRPLSELDTPEAVAARELAAQNAPPQPKAPAPRAAASRPAPRPTTPLPPATPENSEVAAAEALLESANPHKQKPGLKKGLMVRARSGATLRSRPSDTAEILQSIVIEGKDLELGTQVYNAAGYWWYVTVGKETGWLLQADVAP